jgi:hypothetical protein
MAVVLNTQRSFRVLSWPLTLFAISACRCGDAYSNQQGARHTRTAPEAQLTQTNGSRTSDPWAPGDPGVTEITFDIHTQLGRRAISPLIYGINYDLRNAARQRWGLVRWGGNRCTAYNWETNASNAGSDYLFQNDSFASESVVPAAPILQMIDGAERIDAPIIVTLSNADRVSADKNGGGDVRRSGPDYLQTRFLANHARKSSAFVSSPDLSDRDVYQDELVAYLKSKRPRARLLFSMDNEPELWSHTHAEIFLEPVTYEGLWSRNHAFASAAKAVWPQAEVLGFVSFGYSGYVDLQRAKDSKGRNFIDWYLTQARAAERAEGRRLIDYLDLHWYPEAQGGGERITGAGIGPAVVASRVQAPRSLWDASYRETSWVRDKHGGPIELLHWVQAKIDRFYPGTKLAITEWNYGAGNHISGALAVGDVLGIFGMEGVSLATYWPLIDAEPYAYAAFRAYRNFDDEGSAFGDTAVSASSNALELATVYASIQSNDPKRMVVIAINKSTRSLRAGIRISHDTEYLGASVFVLSDKRPELLRAAPLSAVASNAFRFDMPAQSISVIVPNP